MGIENSGEALLTETTDWFQELFWDFRAKTCYNLGGVWVPLDLGAIFPYALSSYLPYQLSDK